MGASGAAAGPVHPTIGAIAATKRGWRNIALEGFSEDDNQDGFVDPIGPAVVAAAPTPASPEKGPCLSTYEAIKKQKKFEINLTGPSKKKKKKKKKLKKNCGGREKKKKKKKKK